MDSGQLRVCLKTGLTQVWDYRNWCLLNMHVGCPFNQGSRKYRTHCTCNTIRPIFKEDIFSVTFPSHPVNTIFVLTIHEQKSVYTVLAT